MAGWIIFYSWINTALSLADFPLNRFWMDVFKKCFMVNYTYLINLGMVFFLVYSNIDIHRETLKPYDLFNFFYEQYAIG